jgi:hypothetical protein
LIIELHIFSGRPNPVWAPSSEECAQIRARLARAITVVDPPAPDRLGYRGFSLRGVGGSRSGDSQPEIRVYSGVIEVIDRNEARYYADTGQLEQFLLGTNEARRARAHRSHF